MAIRPIGHTAQIIQFPVHGAKPLAYKAGQRGASGSVTKIVDVDGWYHEAAVAAERNPTPVPRKGH